jgi:hypothetical protein
MGKVAMLSRKGDMDIVLLIIVGIAVAIIFAVTGVWLGHRLLRERLADGHHDVLVALFQTGGTLHAVFLALLVVAVWQSYDAARANIAEEASALATLYRASTGMEPGAGKELRSLVREYAEAVIENEWEIQAETGGPAPGRGLRASRCTAFFGREDPAVKQSDAAINEAALELISQVQSDRNRRTLEAQASLPTVIWLAAIGSGTIVLSMSFLLFSERIAPRMILTSIIASTIALLLCITFVLSRPFSGPMALQPEPFRHSLEVFDAVDATST